MFTDGAALPADMFESVYPSVSLNAESYQTEQQRGGLYWRAGDATIPDNVTMLLFEYFTPENTLIVRENIPVVYDGKKGDKGDKGDTGADGTPAPMYLGMFEAVPATRSDGTAIVAGDTYLNSTSKTLYKWTGSSWLTLPQTDPGWWAAMGDAIKHAADTGNQVEAANIWVQYLVAGTILAENIMSKQLTLKTGGLIKSENYKAGQQGFCINADGSSEFNNGVFRGNLQAGNINESEGGFTEGTSITAEKISAKQGIFKQLKTPGFISLDNQPIEFYGVKLLPITGDIYNTIKKYKPNTNGYFLIVGSIGIKKGANTEYAYIYYGNMTGGSLRLYGQNTGLVPTIRPGDDGGVARISLFVL